ncbi:DUF1232 domain-containing protein [Parabacteroides sp.]
MKLDLPLNKKPDFVDKFMKGAWLQKARDMVDKRDEIKDLLRRVSEYIPKKELRSIKDQLVLMTDFVSDAILGKYTGYNITKLILMVGALIYLVALVDVLPDWLPLGLMDDSAILMWVFKEVQVELERYSLHKGII